MEKKIIKHGNHVMGNDEDGYIYSFNTSRSYNFSSHLHACYEFIHIVRGNIMYTVEGNDYMLKDGDLIMTKPVELHSFSFPKEGEYQREFLHIYPGFIKDIPELARFLEAREAGQYNKIPAEIVQKYGIDEIFRGIEKVCTDKTPETDVLVLSYSIQLIAKLRQVMRSEKPEKNMTGNNKKTEAIHDYIDSNFKRSISLDDIAAALYASPSYLSRMFRRETGMTIKSYLNMRRVTHAKSLIMQGQPISRLFYECGFNDYSTFYRAFTKYVGMTPHSFKSTHNKKEKSGTQKK